MDRSEIIIRIVGLSFCFIVALMLRAEMNPKKKPNVTSGAPEKSEK